MTILLPESQVRRRELLRFLTRIGALAGIGPLAACGGGTIAGSGNPSPVTAVPAFSSRIITGTVDGTQIGGNLLRVQTPYQLMGPVQAGAFSTLVSTAGAQLLLVTDDSARLRALSVVLPSDSQATINASSTALGILFVSDGITTVNADEAAAVGVKLKNQPQFPAFASYLATQLPMKDVLTLAGDAQFNSLRDAVVTAYLSSVNANVTASLRHTAMAARPSSVEANLQAVTGLNTGLVDGSYSDPTLANNNKAAVSLTNNGYRFVAVGRQELNASRSEIGAAIPTLVGAQNVLPTIFPNLISGVNLTSWGNLATSQVGSAGSATDLFDASIRTNVAFYDYFVVGPGLGTNLVKVPSSLNNLRVGPATLATLLFYGIGPMLDMVSGGPAILKKLGQVVADTSKVDELVSTLEGAGINGLGFQSSAESGDTQNIKGATVDFALAVTGLAGLLTVAAPEFAALAFFATVTGAVSALFSARSYLQTVKNLSTAPSVGVVEVQPVVLPRFSAQILAQDVYFIASGQGGALTQMTASLNDVGNVLYLSGLNDTRFSPQPCLIQNTNTSTPSSTKLPLDPNFSIQSLSRLNGSNHFAISSRNKTTFNARVIFHDGISYSDIGDFGPVTAGVNQNIYMELGGLSDADEIVGYYLKDASHDVTYGVYRWQKGPGLQDQGMNDFRTGGIAYHDSVVPVNNSHQFAVARFPGYASGLPIAGTLAIYAPARDPVFVESVASIPVSCFMNNNAKVVYSLAGGSGPAFKVFQNGQTGVLPPLPQISSTGAVIYQVTGLNDQGWIVGRCFDKEGDSYLSANLLEGDGPAMPVYPGLTLWINDKPHPLASLIEDKPVGFTTLTDVVGINNKGQILAYSEVPKGPLVTAGVTSTLVLLTQKI